jgi:medium-chain acyl-[acyl-carrier-protein] hydrolase
MSDPLVSAYGFEIYGFDCGYGGPLRAFALANFLQDAAGRNAAEHGFGMDDLHASGLTWMLSRIEIKVDELPREGERVLVRTWPAGTRKLFAMRAVDMRRPDGGSLVRAVYAYLVVDMGSRKLLRPESLFGKGIPSADEPLPVPGYAFDMPDTGPAELAFTERVMGRHIDHNGHANNAHLIDWLVDASAPASGAAREESSLAAIRVEFSAEALEGDELSALRSAPIASPFEAGLEASVAELTRGGAKVARAAIGRRRAQPR